MPRKTRGKAEKKKKPKREQERGVRCSNHVGSRHQPEEARSQLVFRRRFRSEWPSRERMKETLGREPVALIAKKTKEMKV